MGKVIKRTGIFWGLCICLLFGCGQARMDNDQIGQEQKIEENTEDNSTGENDNIVINIAGEEGETDKVSERGEKALEEYVILEEMKEEGSQKDSFYQESLLLEYDFYMPQVEGLSAQAAEKIGQWQERERDTFLQEMEEQTLLADCDCLERLTDPDEERRGWGVPCIYSVGYSVFQSEGVVSFLKEEYQYYCGAAHGNTSFSGITFNSNTGEELTLDDFLDGSENGRIALAQYLIEQVDGESLWDDYKESIVYKIVFEPQFYVEEGSMVFLFDQYELASYAQGPVFMEVPLDGKREVKDQEAIEKWAANLQFPGEVNHYLVEIPVGETVIVDLDGDGKEEVIFYQEENPLLETALEEEITLMIEGKEFRLAAGENIIRESIGLVDIDCEDGKYEFAIRANGTSDDHVTAFYRYDSGEMKEIGRTECVIDRNSTNTWKAYLSGDGSVRGSRTIRILENCQVNVRWDLDSETDTLQLYEKENYEPFAGWHRERPYELTGEILIYGRMDRASEHMTVTGENTQIIQFLSTDGENWMEVELFMDGEFKRGWMYIKDNIYIEVGENQFAPGYECIKNL